MLFADATEADSSNKEDLPVERVLHTEAPITHAGIDYLGRLRLKEAGGLSKDTYGFSPA